MNRLLMAASRGALIEEAYHRAEGIHWIPCNVVYTDGSYPDEHRIHPDDAHLEYGPVSTALRKAAEFPPSDLDAAFPSNLPVVLCMPYSDYALGRTVSDLHRSLFLLILAEALCDEGL